MAGVGLSPNNGSNGPNEFWTAAQTRAQFAAIARLRWRMTVNSFRRKGGAGELSLILFPILTFVSERQSLMEKKLSPLIFYLVFKDIRPTLRDRKSVV